MALINTADKIYIGATAADAVYAGANKVWPPAVVSPPWVGGPSNHLLATYSPSNEHNNYTGEVGYMFRILEATTFTWIGLRCSPGNSGRHKVTIYTTAPEVVSTVSIDMTGKTPGSYVWAPVTPFALDVLVYYFLVTTVTDGGQSWGEEGPATYNAPVDVNYSLLRPSVDDPFALGSGPDLQFAGLDLGWGTAFKPSDLPGLNVWLDAAQLALADGATVTTWPNLGSGSAPTVIAGTPPLTLKANAANGYGVVRFSGDSGASYVRGTTSINHDFTIIYVTRRWGPHVGRAFMAPNPPVNIFVGFHGVGMDSCYDNGWLTFGTPWSSSPPDPWRLYSYDGASPTNGTRFFVDGVLTNTQAAGEGFQGTYGLSGYEASSPSELIDGDIAEVLIYDHKLADADRITVEGYLRTKWGL